MKKIILKVLLFVCGSIFQTACNDASYKSVDNLVYISEASVGKIKDLPLLEEVNTISMTVRMARAVDRDIKVTISMDKGWLDEYNRINETAYKFPDPQNISFPKSVVIKAGKVSSEPIHVEVKTFETSGAQYALPISIQEVEGEVVKASGSSRFIFLFVKPLKQPVPKFTTGYNGMKALPDGEWNMSLPNYTLEWWSKVSSKDGSGGYTINNQAVFTSGGKDTELYVRFGDLIYAQGGAYKNNFLQVKTMGSQFDTGNPVTGEGLVGGKWYHFAITYDGGSGTTLLYKNGQKVAALSTGEGRDMVINGLSIISSGNYWRDVCEMCQVRFWKVTRTQNQIQKNMYSEVEYNHKDLILYYPMNEGKGTKIKDVTGNGHDTEVGSMYPGNSNGKIVTWNEYSFAQ
ncbi:BT_3987 domain-containing protein [Bacteroides pyogenes]|uniref:BT_3987 domain-containing protein n=1 Tax=Bacteroides pyogenes TaxID=310300 RepID=UPI0011E489DB|nr:DUF1735 domain-containing protein [Bacteroides pyogenes]TYK42301.1 DUF1735 domain-containing protein [Bacteroides pyogenes]